nr:MAG TPA: hypothetical protein [Caudoviricetes sp.]
MKSFFHFPRGHICECKSYYTFSFLDTLTYLFGQNSCLP